MVGPQCLSHDGKGPTVERLGLGEFPLMVEIAGKDVRARGHGTLLHSAELEPNGKGPPVKRLGFRILPLASRFKAILL